MNYLLNTVFILAIVLVPASSAFAQIIPQRGPYDIGFEVYDSDPDESVELRTAVWYPTVQNAGGNSAAYPWHGGEWHYESPFLGVTDSDQIPSGESFPIVAMSHGWGAWHTQFSYLGEALASHGYVVTAPYHSTNDVGPRADELLQTVTTLLDRSNSADDKLHGVADSDSIVLGGYSWGSPTTTSAVSKAASTGIDIDAVVLVDGSPNANFNVDIPVLHIGGGNAVLNHVRSRIDSSGFYTIDIGSGDDSVRSHHWSFGVNGCQIRESVRQAGLVAGATEEEIRQSVRPDSFWLGCDANYIPPTEVQERMKVHTLAFLESVIKDNHHGRPLIAPNHQTTAGDLWITVSVDSSHASKGLAVMLTDPEGRSIGLDAESGEMIDDFAGETIGTLRRARRDVTFGIPQELLLPGEYTLAAVGTTLDESQTYSIELGTSIDRGEDIVFSQFQVVSGSVEPNQAIDPFRFTLSTPERTAPTIDELFAAIREGTGGDLYDVSFDGFVDSEDIRAWVHQIANTYFGDANLDGEFNAADLTLVFESGQYEDGVGGNSIWSTGDWNGDGEFDSRDFVLAFQDGGYEEGPRPAAVPVPEPSSVWLFLVAIPMARACIFVVKENFALSDNEVLH
ncbi:MAG: hypothetical protein KDB27_04005 [Planctomycetales bacterium]|nr:hypothetical protein [Planctomycetales bacterium]